MPGNFRCPGLDHFLFSVIIPVVQESLHITSLRRGPDGDPKSPHAANLDESKATSYTNLPDPLLLKKGKKVRSEEIWWKLRRPEIVEDFDREIYGRVPPNAPSVNWQVTSTTREMNDAVPVITKKIVGHVDNSSYPLVTVDIQLTLTTPAQAAGLVPVIMEFIFRMGPRTPSTPPKTGTWRARTTIRNHQPTSRCQGMTRTRILAPRRGLRTIAS